MPTGLVWKAGAIIALAFVLILAQWASPNWGPPMVPVVGGLILAALFVRTYVREAPSLERFRRLSFYGMGAVAGLLLGTMFGISRLPLGLDFVERGWIMVGTFLVILAGLMVFSVWQAIAVHNYAGPKPPNPDFEEDAEGNPVRHRDPDG